jgi:putative ABC transport system substrate-binding protein
MECCSFCLRTFFRYSKIPSERTFSLLCAMLLALCASASAQQPRKVPRIGYLFTGLLAPKEFLQALQELGYVEGKNIAVEFRAAEGKEERLPALAAELARLNVDVIVAPGTAPAQAARQATKTIPIVYTGGADPVVIGLVASLARPGGNVTGVTSLSRELTGKRLELLKETFPKVSVVAVLTRGVNPVTTELLKDMEAAANALRLRLQIVKVGGPTDFDRAFSAITKERAESLIELPSPLFHSNRRRIVEFAAKTRLPSIFHSRDFVDAGGLMCYGEHNADLLRRVAYYVDRILKGAKPADLPVEQPTKFEMIINLKTAKQIGVTIPPNVLARADRVIR